MLRGAMRAALLRVRDVCSRTFYDAHAAEMRRRACAIRYARERSMRATICVVYGWCWRVQHGTRCHHYLWRVSARVVLSARCAMLPPHVICRYGFTFYAL